MAEQVRSAGRAFISHCWRDKPLARRIARRLAHRGVVIWIDEAEMQVGDRLSDRLAAEIKRSDFLVVLLTTAARASRWVDQEIAVAKACTNPVVTIIPLIAEGGAGASVLDDSIGVEITDPLTFENVLDTVAGAMLGAPVSDQRDRALLRRDLGLIAGEAPELRALVTQLADEGRITHSQVAALMLGEPSRHPAETALIALFELADVKVRYVIALVAAECYRQLGVGYEVLRRQSLIGPKDDVGTMFNHFGGKITRLEDFAGAFRLFQLATPPQDQAFAAFVDANFDRFTKAHQDQAVAYIVTPDRGPAGSAVDAAYSLYSRMPDSDALRSLWWFWVNDYKFGGRLDVEQTQSANTFFGLMNEATHRGLTQFEPVMQHFERRFRDLARSADTLDLLRAVGLLTAAADARYVHRRQLARQLMDALNSTEWHGRRHRDLLYRPISHLVKAINTDQDYWDAIKELEPVVAKIIRDPGEPG